MTLIKKIFYNPETGRLNSHLAGHFLQFAEKSTPQYDSKTGMRLLLIFVLLEGIIGPRFSLASMLGISVPPASIRIPILLFVALLLVKFVAKIEFNKIGLYPWRDWTTTERSYFLQVLVLVNIIFPAMQMSNVQLLLSNYPIWFEASIIFLVQIMWGFYQELMYRGILQTELVRRWGSLKGVLVANILFTFGPLHFYHFQQSGNNPSHLWIFAAIFAIGLFFGVLFRRSGNLWMIGIFHGIGDWYIEGLPKVVALIK